MKKYINLDELPRKPYNGTQRIDWKNSIGYKCDFVYENIIGEVEIIDCIDHKIVFKYKDKIDTISSTNFSRCNFARILNKTKNFKLELNTTFTNNERNATIISREYRTDNKGIVKKWYKLHCNKCNCEYWVVEQDVVKQKQCNVCGKYPKIVVKGVNDALTKCPEIKKYLVDVEDGYKYTKNSKQKIHVRCPDCGELKYIPMSYLTSRGLVCSKCGDGKSYPNKFMFNILEQLNIDFEAEYSPKWSNSRFYDFYIPSLKIIIEMDGYFHYKDNNLNKRKKEESIKIDLFKDEVAYKHGIKVIRVDCNYSRVRDRFEYIKNSILNSELINYFDFGKIVWETSDKYCHSNICKQFCLFYEDNRDLMNISKMCEIFKIGRDIGTKYLKVGGRLGWCKYNTKHYMNKVKVVETNDIFDSVNMCASSSLKLYGVQFNSSGIHRVCKGEKSDLYGYHFEYVS